MGADVPATGDVELESTGVGQVVTGLAGVTLIGQLRGAIDVKLNTLVPYLQADEIDEGAITKTAGLPIPCININAGNVEVPAINTDALVVASLALLDQPAAEPALSARLIRAATKPAEA